ncbi:MmcQ/YjbR family DNA-binding protein [Nocardioides litoris]|uniref:MmcQ/YjbR family DNA-binding protein n=1 Tax=Nocardioides litoris TaxID=1926648 RepID=UPI00111FC6D0|nr:MmcQ/YjbR family DNA-binding protein [Nocardioides litoris]
MVKGRPEPPLDLVERVGTLARALPEADEEEAWTGVRWRVRTRTFAHVHVLAGHWAERWSPGLGERTVVTFRSCGDELLALEAHGLPFLKPDWAPTVVAMVLDDETDWAEVAELVNESYRLLAPRKLARLLDGAADDADPS